MKSKNLKLIFNNFLLNVPEEKITMWQFRPIEDHYSHECRSAGCVIGHSLILDDWEKIPKKRTKNVNFNRWSELFTGLGRNTPKWKWCFSGGWSNDKTQILLRLKYLIDNKRLPSDWDLLGFECFDYVLPIQPLEPYIL